MTSDHKSKAEKDKDKKSDGECKIVRPPLHHCFHFIDQNGDFVSSCCCC